MSNHLYCNVPEASHLAKPFVLNLFVLGPQEILEFAVNILVLRFSCFHVRESEVPSTKDLVTIQVWRVGDSFDERRSIRAQETYGYDDEQNVVQNGHGEEVSVGKAVVADAQVDCF